MNILSPLKFHPILRDKIWGGEKIKTSLHYDFSPLPNCGEAWMISSVPGFESVVSEGALEGNTLNELIEIFMGDLVGDKVYEEFGIDFPLLIKFLDASQWLSIQVHPDDELAQARGFERGKTEMWYILEADEGAELITGFSQKISKAEYQKLLDDKSLQPTLNYEPVKKGDVFYIPSGRVHAIGPGILLAEIQQSADLTYRIYDWDRVDNQGNPRQLHVTEALDAIDFKVYKNYKTDYQIVDDQTVPIVDEKYFTTNLMHFHQPVSKDYEELDSFVIYMVTEGSIKLRYSDGEMDLGKGEVILLPAVMDHVDIFPTPMVNLLEIYIK